MPLVNFESKKQKQLGQYPTIFEEHCIRTEPNQILDNSYKCCMTTPTKEHPLIIPDFRSIPIA